jgi:hypothetical protein
MSNLCVLGHHPLRLPVSLCNQGHLACATCYKIWSDSAKYKIGRDSEGLPTVEAFRDSELSLECPFKCGPTIVQQAKQRAAMTHKDSAMQVCLNCETSFTGCRHVFTCPQQTIICKVCKASVLLSAYNTHIQKECSHLACHICVANDPVPLPTYTFEALRVHLGLHQKSTELRTMIFHYYAELGKLLGRPARSGDMFIPTSETQIIDGRDFLDEIAILASMRQLVEGRRGANDRLADSIPIPPTVLATLLRPIVIPGNK